VRAVSLNEVLLRQLVSDFHAGHSSRDGKPETTKKADGASGSRPFFGRETGLGKAHIGASFSLISRAVHSDSISTTPPSRCA
jgi:hypothetical protein